MNIDEVAVAIDFGNLKLRIGVNYKGTVEILKNEANYCAFSQIFIDEKKSNLTSFGFEAETNSVGNYDCCFKEFKYNKLIRKDNTDEMIVKTLRYYKSISEYYVKDRFNEEIQNIDKVVLTIPSYDYYNNNIWTKLLIKCSREAGFNKIITMYEDEAAIRYFDMNISEEDRNYYCLFSLGSLYFTSSLYIVDKKSIRMIKTSSDRCIYKKRNARTFFIELQKLFDEKIKNKNEKEKKKKKIKVSLNFSDQKYLAECYKKYHKLLDDFSGKLNSVQIEFRQISNKPIEIAITRDEMNQVLDKTKQQILNLINDTKKVLSKHQFIFKRESFSKDTTPVTLLFNGNGFRFPGLQDLFKEEFKDIFHPRHVFYNEEILKGALQNSTNYTFELIPKTEKQIKIKDPMVNRLRKNPLKSPTIDPQYDSDLQKPKSNYIRGELIEKIDGVNSNSQIILTEKKQVSQIKFSGTLVIFVILENK